MRLVLLACLLLPTAASAEEVVRIAVVERSGKPVTVSAEGLRARPMVDGASYAEVDGGEATLTRKGDLLLLDGDDTGAVAVKLRSDGPIRVAGKVLRGAVEVLLDDRGLLAVNELSMEDYLAAVLGSEMPPGFHPEALKAQAVAARTYALGKKLAAGERAFHLGATVLSQVYGGVHREDPRTKAAVDGTRGEVMVFDHEPVEAYFFSSCGGRTAGGVEALGRDRPYLQPVACPERKNAPGSSWTLTLSPAELSKRLKLANVTDVEVAARTQTGRAAKVKVKAAGTWREIGGVDFRARLGYGELDSLLFDVDREKGSFVFRGKGSGHGTGLCQWGARAHAEAGRTYREILEHYSRGAEVRRMY